MASNHFVVPSRLEISSPMGLHQWMHTQENPPHRQCTQFWQHLFCKNPWVDWPILASFAMFMGIRDIVYIYIYMCMYRYAFTYIYTYIYICVCVFFRKGNKHFLHSLPTQVLISIPSIHVAPAPSVLGIRHGAAWGSASHRLDVGWGRHGYKNNPYLDILVQ